MKSTFERLLKISGSPIVPHAPSHVQSAKLEKCSIGKHLCELLRFRNGFFAFDEALFFIPLFEHDGVDIASWNQTLLWRNYFGHLIPPELTFFGMDIFGNQFGFDSKHVVSFDSETAEIEVLSDSLSEWLDQLINDPNVPTGAKTATEWRKTFGAIPLGSRLIPKVPFVLGGPYEIENLYCGTIVEAMKFRGTLARRIELLEDGDAFQLHFI